MPDVESGGRIEVPIYPWHAASWGTLTARLDRLPHALLLQGPAGLGKRAFALRLAQTLLCEKPGANAAACGGCKSCLLFSAGTHPDLTFVEPGEESTHILIDQVRALNESLTLMPHTAARKVAILAPAEAMNLNAANSLLKILEEPPLGSVLLLVTHQPTRLPATVRSRCAHVALSPPERAEALSWLRTRPGMEETAGQLLELAGVAPLRALALAGAAFLEKRAQLIKDLEVIWARQDEVLSAASRWKSSGSELCLAWLYVFVADLIRCLQAGADSQVVNPEAKTLWHKYKNTINSNELYHFINDIPKYKNLLSSPLDEQLLLEDVLLGWYQIVHPATTMKIRRAP